MGVAVGPTIQGSLQDNAETAAMPEDIERWQVSSQSQGA